MVGPTEIYLNYLLLDKDDEFRGWPSATSVKYTNKRGNRFFAVELSSTGAAILSNWGNTSSGMDKNESFVLASYLEENLDTYRDANPDWPDWATEAYMDIVRFLTNRSHGCLSGKLKEQERELERKETIEQVVSDSPGSR